jgi:[ribosomal protein S5]-alanine N-acetyltransferase
VERDYATARAVTEWPVPATDSRSCGFYRVHLTLSNLSALPELDSFPMLTTSRLVLREISTDDAAALLSIHGDVEMMKWFGSEPILDEAGALALVGVFASWRSLPNPGIRFAIQLKESPELIGTIGLFKWNRIWRTCSIGYELSGTHHGKGIMNEAAQAAIAWGFDAMDLNRIEAQIHPNNAASISLAKRLGFLEEGRLREAGYWNGGPQDLFQYSLLRSEWNSAHPH